MTEKFENEIDRLFNEEILPLAARLKRRNVILLDTELVENASSYFVKRTNAQMSKIDFESGGCASPDSIEAELRLLWNHCHDGSLAPLAPKVARLGRLLHEVLQEETGDISHFIYAMY